MVLRVGQKVVIKQSLGRLGNRGRSEYFYKGDRSLVPLNTQGRVFSISGRGNEIHLILDNPKLGYEGKFLVYPDEIREIESSVAPEALAQKKMKLHTLLIDEPAKEPLPQSSLRSSGIQLEPAPLYGEGGTYNNRGWMNRTMRALEHLVPQNEPEDDGSFKPSFNVREEFVLWVQKEFPNLRSKGNKKDLYDKLRARKKDILNAARMTYHQSKGTLTGCAWSGIEQSFNHLLHNQDSEPEVFANGLDSMVYYIQKVSLSLGGDKYHTEAGVIGGIHE